MLIARRPSKSSKALTASSPCSTTLTATPTRRKSQKRNSRKSRKLIAYSQTRRNGLRTISSATRELAPQAAGRPTSIPRFSRTSRICSATFSVSEDLDEGRANAVALLAAQTSGTTWRLRSKKRPGGWRPKSRFPGRKLAPNAVAAVQRKAVNRPLAQPAAGAGNSGTSRVSSQFRALARTAREWGK